MAKGKEGRPAKKGTVDSLLEEIQRISSQSTQSTPHPAEVPPRDDDKTTGATEPKATPQELQAIFREVPSKVIEKYEKITSPKRQQSFIENLKESQKREAERENERRGKDKKSTRSRERKPQPQPEVTPPVVEVSPLVVDKSEKLTLSVVLETLEKPVAKDTAPAPEEDILTVDPADTPPDINSRAEGKGLLKRLIENAKGKLYDVGEKFKMSERGEKAKAYLAERSKGLSEKAKEYGSDHEKLVRDIGEYYNKLSLVKKIVLGGAMTIGVATFSSVSTPLAMLFGGAIATQRAFGMAGMFVNLEKHLQSTSVGTSENFIGKREWYKNFIAGKSEQTKKNIAATMAMVWSYGMGAGIAAGVREFNQSEYGHQLHSWLRSYWTHPEVGASVASSSASEAVSPPVSEPTPPKLMGHSGYETQNFAHPDTPPPVAPDAEVPTTQPDIPPAAATAAGEGAPPVAPATPEASDLSSISVEASKGHGYEHMMKRVWEQLQEKQLDPSNYAEGSDIRRLLDADPKSINTVIHDLAKENGFFKPDGTSVRIDLGSHMTVSEDGDILFGDKVFALESAPITPAIHSEAFVIQPTSEALPSQDMVIETPPVPPIGTIIDASTVVQDDLAKIKTVEAPEYENTTTALPPDAPPASELADSPNAFVNSYGTPINPDVAHGYMSPKGLYLFGGTGDLDAQALEYVLKNKISVFVDHSYKNIFGFDVSRVVEFAPTENGAPAMVIHHDASLVPDPTTFTKRLF